MRYVKSTAEIVGQHLKKGAVVVLESTVYTGVTEEIIAPILDLENESGLKCGADFKIGYSPERINPGDESYTLDKITKIVEGMDKLFCKQKPLLKNAYAIRSGNCRTAAQKRSYRSSGEIHNLSGRY